MGLCKCKRKKFTNQFCFEHSTNVCEHCMVTDHPKCIIQSYLKWLDSSEYDPVCRVCSALLSSGECVRLVCYDVFHKECLNTWASQLPPNTAPAGYKCPVCSQPVFPAPNLVSPVADYLRETLAAYPWARIGLGLPMIDKKSDEGDWSAMNGGVIHSTTSTTTSQPPPASLHSHQESHLRVNTHGRSGSDGGGGNSNTANSSNVRVTAMEDPPITPSQFRDHHHHHQQQQHQHSSSTASTPSSSVARKGSSSSDTKLLVGDGVDVDESENKYKRRSAVEWFARWWRTMNRPASRHHQGLRVGVRRMLVVLVVVGVLTLIVLLSYLSQGASNNDPMLDPLNNPNIRVQED